MHSKASYLFAYDARFSHNGKSIFFAAFSGGPISCQMASKTTLNSYGFSKSWSIWSKKGLSGGNSVLTTPQTISTLTPEYSWMSLSRIPVNPFHGISGYSLSNLRRDSFRGLPHHLQTANYGVDRLAVAWQRHRNPSPWVNSCVSSKAGRGYPPRSRRKVRFMQAPPLSERSVRFPVSAPSSTQDPPCRQGVC